MGGRGLTERRLIYNFGSEGRGLFERGLDSKGGLNELLWFITLFIGFESLSFCRLLLYLFTLLLVKNLKKKYSEECCHLDCIKESVVFLLQLYILINFFSHPL